MWLNSSAGRPRLFWHESHTGRLQSGGNQGKQGWGGGRSSGAGLSAGWQPSAVPRCDEGLGHQRDLQVHHHDGCLQACQPSWWCCRRVDPSGSTIGEYLESHVSQPFKVLREETRVDLKSVAGWRPHRRESFRLLHWHWAALGGLCHQPELYTTVNYLSS